VHFLQLFFNIFIFFVISNSYQIKSGRDDFACYLYLLQNQTRDATRVQNFEPWWARQAEHAVFNTDIKYPAKFKILNTHGPVREQAVLFRV